METSLRQAIDVTRENLWRCQSDEEIRRLCRAIMKPLAEAAALIEERDPSVRHRLRNWRGNRKSASVFVDRPCASIGTLQWFLKGFGHQVARELDRLSQAGALSPA